MKLRVLRVTAGSTTRLRAALITVGAEDSGGWCTLVLDSTTPASWLTWRKAQPSEIGPPQSWATVTTGPVSPSAAVSVSRSSTR